MPGMFDVALAFQDVVNGLDDAALAQKDFIPQGHQLIFHVLFDASAQLQALLPELIEQGLRNVALIAEQLAGQSLG